MALALCTGALGFGMLADQLRRRGVGVGVLLAVVAILFLASELSIGLHWPVPALALWCVIGVTGAATVISYAMMAEIFDKTIAGRANAALNLMHFGGAFAVQSLFGLLLSNWPQDSSGRYPAAAYQAAFLVLAALQLIALLWFVLPWVRRARNTALPFGTKPLLAAPTPFDTSAKGSLQIEHSKRRQRRERGRSRAHFKREPLVVEPRS
jgi:MFS family permease